jgi:CubicO group peptidase (beta-lactamase class C family)
MENYIFRKVIKHAKLVIKVFYLGFGYRDISKDLPVTPQTVFAIASCTKAFTSSMLAILNQEKKISWEEEIKDILPLDLQDEFGMKIFMY